VNKQVLLVDDEASVLASLGRILRKAGITYISAQSGEEALGLIQQHQILVVISDYRMPGMTGTELLAKIEAQFPTTTRIILSAHADFDTVLQAVHSGVVHKFLAKPWSNEEFLEHIQSALLAQTGQQASNQTNDFATDNEDPSTLIDDEGSLSVSEKKLNVVLDTVIDGMITINRAGVILSVNRALESVFGYSAVELLGQNISKLMPEPYRSQHDHYLSHYQGREKGGIVGNRRRLVGLRKNGEVFPIELSVNRMQIEGETQFLGMIRDISRRVSAERENQLLIEALESSQDGFALFGAGDKLIRWNRQFEALYQSCSEVLKEGVTYREFFESCINHGLFPDAQENPTAWLAEREAAHHSLPMVAELQLETGKWVEIHETRSENGSVIVTHLDITTLKQTQLSLEDAVKSAEHANAARGRFLAMMSHEIRTPLNGVLGLLQLMQDTSLTTKQKLYIETAAESGQSLLTIISDILDFSKIEAEKLVLQPVPCELQRMLQEMKQLFHLRVEEKSIQLHCDMDVALPEWVNVDAQRLRQVLLNLLGNSIKFTDYGEVRLSLTLTKQGRIRFLVNDTGIGIPLNEQQKIFSEFSTVKQAKSDKVYEGTGLGLAISYKLVNLMGGELKFRSEPEKGSQFWFEIPLIECVAAAQPPHRLAYTDKLQGHVLLVDDSATNRLVAKAMLESAGVTITTAEDGYRALELYPMIEFDLILMDISMPGIDGLETAIQLKGLPEWKSTPIIAVTAYAMPEDEQRFLANGMSDYVEKPLDKNRLLQVIGRYLPSSLGLIQGANENLDAPAEKRERKPEDLLSPMLDPEKIEQLVKDTSEEILPELCQIFISDASERLDELQQENLDRNLDLNMVERQLHTLGSSAALYGLIRFCEQARLLEQQCIAGCSVTAELAAFVILGRESLEHLEKHIQAR
jgi:PAS domain S-box-containing protein